MGEIKHKNVHILHQCAFFRIMVLCNYMSQVESVQYYTATTQLTIDNTISNAIEGRFKLSIWLSAALLQVALSRT